MRPLAGGRVRAMCGAVLLVVASMGISGLFAGSQGAGATTSDVTVYVNGTAGTEASGCTGPGATACATIQEGVTAAETHATDAVTVTVSGGTYTVKSTGPVTISTGALSSLTVQGAGASATTISGGGAVRDFTVSGSAVTLRDLAIDDGDGDEAPGGGVDSAAADATFTDDAFADDTATLDDVPGVYKGSVLRGSPSTLVRNAAFSAEVPAEGRGGGVYSTGASATFTDDTFSDDSAGEGGGVYSTGASATFTNDTFSDDSARGIVTGAFAGGRSARPANGAFRDAMPVFAGGGVDVQGASSSATLTDDTFSGGSGGGVDAVDGSTATVDSSVFDASECSQTDGTLSGTYDVWTATTGCTALLSGVGTTATAVDLTTTLGTNTAPSAPETLALLSGSPAIDEVPARACTVSTDERGFPRPGIPGQSSCDAGAYEHQAPPSTCIPYTRACEARTSRAGTSTTLTSDEVTVTASGRGWVAVGTYGKDPSGRLASSTGKFFGLALSSPGALTSLAVTDCDLAGGSTLEWWNGRTWLPVVSGPPTALTRTTSTCTSVTLGQASSPSLSAIAKLSRLSRFEAVVFGVTGSDD